MTELRPIRVMIADDHTIVREGLVSLLQEGGVCTVVAQAADGLEAVEKALEARPDVAIFDLTMPKLSGLEAVRRVHEALPATRIMVLTVHDEDEYIIPIVRAGASGYLVKDTASADLITAVKTLYSGQAYFGPQAARALADQYSKPDSHPEDPYGALTPREREVFHLVIEGKTTKEIARELDISPKTAENHRARVIDKLKVHNTAGLVRYAARHGLLS
ncbi:MAG: response regulator transcription factor [Gammaproteobacteria bacterium]|nr:response regulator transcription factor [Gammaproteobacteria bacterium]